MSRFDNRSRDEFARDIKECSEIEHDLMVKYVAWLNSMREKDAPEYQFKDNGIDNTGQFIEKCSDITTDADFLLVREGKPPRKIDIKFCRPDRDKFHLKVSQMLSYVQDDVCIVNFMGIDGNNKRFCILPPDQLAWWLQNGERIKFKPFGYKESIKFDVNNEHLVWHNYE